MANSHSRMKLLNQYRQRTMPNYAPLVLMNLTANHANHADRKNHPRRGCSRGSSISRFTASGQCSGNLTNDGTWTLTWDAENRLVNMTSLSSGPARSKLKLDFSYDHQGRRIQKVVSTWNGSSYTSPSTNQFVYDGWNLLAELDTSHSALRTYVWGLDLSGTLQGAGGVGGLLAITDASHGSHFCAHDGNGNVTALVKADGSGLAAQYEYGPFGEPLRATGPMARANPFRFSTKYQDDETDLIYYGYRYYKADTGTWPNRDPLGELAFFQQYARLHKPGELPDQPPVAFNPYAFIDNNPISYTDMDGCRMTPEGDVAITPQNRRRPPGKMILIQVPKCTILFVYGHNYVNNFEKKGLQWIWNIVPANDADRKCSYAAVACCSADVVPNEIPLPGFQNS